MTIKILHDLDSDGGFVCVDLTTGISAYAYPSSTHAVAAKRSPVKVAREMIANEIPALHFGSASLVDQAREDRLRARNGLAPRRLTVGQIAYELELLARPRYPDGTHRKAWVELGEAERSTWERNPTPRWTA